MKAIFFFSNSKSNSGNLILNYFKFELVLFECANTLSSISTAPTALKLAINIYIQLLCGNTDNNVKIITLDKLLALKRGNAKLLED